jgi:hypothetical protein
MQNPIRLLAASASFAVTALLMTPAHAELVDFSFTGAVTAASSTAPLSPYIAANDPVSGYFIFDPSTVPTTPGVFDLPDAQFHIQFDQLTFDVTGATAQVSVNQDGLVFSASIPGSEFPIPVDSATITYGFQTFDDGYFSLSSLPTTVPPHDETLGLSYTVPNNRSQFGASTDTNLHTTATLVPEPASVAIMGLAMAGLLVARRRRAA